MSIALPHLSHKFLRAAKWFHSKLLVQNTSSRGVSLTFDDGPSKYTPRLLDVLVEAGVKVTFFLVGDRCEIHPEVVRRIYREGHHIGLHGYEHKSFLKLSKAEFFSSIEKNISALRNAIGREDFQVQLIRPPFGLISRSQIRFAAAASLKIAFMAHLPGHTTIWPRGWQEPPPLMLERVRKHLRSGDIITLHDGEDINKNDGIFDMPQVSETASLFIKHLGVSIFSPLI